MAQRRENTVNLLDTNAETRRLESEAWARASWQMSAEGRRAEALRKLDALELSVKRRQAAVTKARLAVKAAEPVVEYGVYTADSGPGGGFQVITKGSAEDKIETLTRALRQMRRGLQAELGG